MRVSVIVPTLNEEQWLPATLDHLLALSREVIVSDGGSTDRTESIARDQGAIWLSGPPGRGAQLNRGAEVADGDALLFVHADTRLPGNALEQVGEAIEQGYAGGGFSVRFDSDIPIMAVGARLVNLRTRVTRMPLGDQAQFVRADLFRRLDGYREWPILEDLDFMRRLKRRGKVTVLHSPVVTSDRRYARRGVWRTVAINWLIWGLYLVGVPPRKLAVLYRDVR